MRPPPPLLPRRLRGGEGAGGRRRRERGAPDHGVPRRRRAGEPHQHRDRRGRRGAGQCGDGGLRRRRRGGGPGRPVRRRVRRVGGLEHPRGRPRRDRGSGDVELADPQLPGLPPRHHRPPARPSGLRPGVDVRRPLRLHAERRGHRARRRPAPGHPLRRDEGPHQRGAARRWGSATAPWGCPSLDALVGAGVFYGGPTSEAPALEGGDAVVVGGANSAGQAVLHLARYARRVTLAVRGTSLARQHVGVPREPGGGHAEHRGAPGHRGRRWRGRRPSRSPGAARHRVDGRSR